MLTWIDETIDDVYTGENPYIPLGSSATRLAERFLDDLAGLIEWRQANEHVATHVFRLDGNPDEHGWTVTLTATERKATG